MIELTRLSDPVHWRKPFEETLDRIKGSPFAYGSHDCALGLVSTLVEAMTGQDPASAYRGRYSDLAGAVAVMKEAGFENLGDMVASILPEIPEGVARAQIGDVAAIPDDGPFGYSLGVVNGERIYVLKLEGLGTVDLLTATRAFRVG